MVLITGGSGSGKSAYAESCTLRLAGTGRKYYIATMRVFNAEGQKKIERHRKLRSGKGFCTIEQPTDIGDAIEKMKESSERENTALLECMSNLAANEMFSGEVPQDEEFVKEKIIQGIGHIYKSLKHLVIVTNNVFEDGRIYDETTMAYIRAMGSINETLASYADRVIEVVAGIPVVVKEEKTVCVS